MWVVEYGKDENYIVGHTRGYAQVCVCVCVHGDPCVCMLVCVCVCVCQKKDVCVVKYGRKDENYIVQHTRGYAQLCVCSCRCMCMYVCECHKGC